MAPLIIRPRLSECDSLITCMSLYYSRYIKSDTIRFSQLCGIVFFVCFFLHVFKLISCQWGGSSQTNLHCCALMDMFGQCTLVLTECGALWLRIMQLFSKFKSIVFRFQLGLCVLSFPLRTIYLNPLPVTSRSTLNATSSPHPSLSFEAVFKRSSSSLCHLPDLRLHFPSLCSLGSRWRWASWKQKSPPGSLPRT